MRFMNERHGRILRFLKPYIKTIYIKIGKYWIKIPITIKKKKNSTIQIYCQQTLLLYTFELIFRRTSLLLPPSIRRITRFPERTGQLGVITAGTCARQRSNYSARSLSLSAVEWQVRGEERARRAHAAACTHTPVSLHPKGKSGGERLTIGDDVSLLSSSTDSRSSRSLLLINTQQSRTPQQPS